MKFSIHAVAALAAADTTTHAFFAPPSVPRGHSLSGRSFSALTAADRNSDGGSATMAMDELARAWTIRNQDDSTGAATATLAPPPPSPPPAPPVARGATTTTTTTATATTFDPSMPPGGHSFSSMDYPDGAPDPTVKEWIMGGDDETPSQQSSLPVVVPANKANLIGGMMDQLAREWSSRNTDADTSGMAPRDAFVTSLAPQTPSYVPPAFADKTQDTTRPPPPPVAFVEPPEPIVLEQPPDAASSGPDLAQLAKEWASLNMEEDDGASGMPPSDAFAGAAAAAATVEPTAEGAFTAPEVPPPTTVDDSDAATITTIRTMEDLARAWASRNKNDTAATVTPPAIEVVEEPPEPIAVVVVEDVEKEPPLDNDLETTAAASTTIDDLAKAWASRNMDDSSGAGAAAMPPPITFDASPAPVVELTQPTMDDESVQADDTDTVLEQQTSMDDLASAWTLRNKDNSTGVAASAGIPPFVDFVPPPVELPPDVESLEAQPTVEAALSVDDLVADAATPQPGALAVQKTEDAAAVSMDDLAQAWASRNMDDSADGATVATPPAPTAKTETAAAVLSMDDLASSWASRNKDDSTGGGGPAATPQPAAFVSPPVEPEAQTPVVDSSEEGLAETDETPHVTGTDTPLVSSVDDLASAWASRNMDDSTGASATAMPPAESTFAEVETEAQRPATDASEKGPSATDDGAPQGDDTPELSSVTETETQTPLVASALDDLASAWASRNMDDSTGAGAAAMPPPVPAVEPAVVEVGTEAQRPSAAEKGDDTPELSSATETQTPLVAFSSFDDLASAWASRNMDDSTAAMPPSVAFVSTEAQKGGDTPELADATETQTPLVTMDDLASAWASRNMDVSTEAQAPTMDSSDKGLAVTDKAGDSAELPSVTGTDKTPLVSSSMDELATAWASRNMDNSTGAGVQTPVVASVSGDRWATERVSPAEPKLPVVPQEAQTTPMAPADESVDDWKSQNKDDKSQIKDDSIPPDENLDTATSPYDDSIRDDTQAAAQTASKTLSETPPTSSSTPQSKPTPSPASATVAAYATMADLAAQWAARNKESTSATPPSKPVAFVVKPIAPIDQKQDAFGEEKLSEVVAPDREQEEVFSEISTDQSVSDIEAEAGITEPDTSVAVAPEDPNTQHSPPPTIEEPITEPVAESPTKTVEPITRMSPPSEDEDDNAPAQLAIAFGLSLLALVPLGMGDLNPSTWEFPPKFALREEYRDAQQQQQIQPRPALFQDARSGLRLTPKPPETFQEVMPESILDAIEDEVMTAPEPEQTSPKGTETTAPAEVTTPPKSLEPSPTPTPTETKGGKGGLQETGVNVVGKVDSLGREAVSQDKASATPLVVQETPKGGAVDGEAAFKSAGKDNGAKEAVPIPGAAADAAKGEKASEGPQKPVSTDAADQSKAALNSKGEKASEGPRKPVGTDAADQVKAALDSQTEQKVIKEEKASEGPRKPVGTDAADQAKAALDSQTEQKVIKEEKASEGPRKPVGTDAVDQAKAAPASQTEQEREPKDDTNIGTPIVAESSSPNPEGISGASAQTKLPTQGTKETETGTAADLSSSKPTKNKEVALVSGSVATTRDAASESKTDEAISPVSKKDSPAQTNQLKEESVGAGTKAADGANSLQSGVGWGLLRAKATKEPAAATKAVIALEAQPSAVAAVERDVAPTSSPVLSDNSKPDAEGERKTDTVVAGEETRVDLALEQAKTAEKSQPQAKADEASQQTPLSSGSAPATTENEEAPKKVVESYIPQTFEEVMMQRIRKK